MEDCVKISYDNKDLDRFLGLLIDDFSKKEPADDLYSRAYNKGLLFGLKIAKSHIKLD